MCSRLAISLQWVRTTSDRCKNADMPLDDPWPGDSPFLELVASSRPSINTVQAQLFVDSAPTGARPLLFRCSDGKNYWSKWPGNPHGNLSLFHELAVAGIGLELGSPVRPVKLVEVDAGLVEGLRIDGVQVPSGRFIGSELLVPSEEVTQIDRVSRDGNNHRYAHLHALYDLCMGADLQLLHAAAADDEVWSIDHGLWFCSMESDWTEDWLRGNIKTPGGWAVRPAGVDAGAYLEAADRVDSLSADRLANTWAGLPTEWGIEAQRQTALARFVLERRAGVSSRMRVLSAHYSKRRKG